MAWSSSSLMASQPGQPPLGDRGGLQVGNSDKTGYQPFRLQPQLRVLIEDNTSCPLLTTETLTAKAAIRWIPHGRSGAK